MKRERRIIYPLKLSKAERIALELKAEKNKLKKSEYIRKLIMQDNSEFKSPV